MMSEKQEARLELARAYVKEARRRCNSGSGVGNDAKYLRASLEMLSVVVGGGVPSAANGS
jgi:hypothetical protein